MKIIQKNNKVIVEDCFEKPFKIPSQMYPLKSEIKIFCSQNTEDCFDEKIIELYNSITPKLGRCYENSKELLRLFKKNDITDIQTYAGWLFVGNQAPTHHCFCVYKNNIVLDFVSDLKHDTNLKVDMSDVEKARRKYVEFILEQQKKSNTERFGKGKVDEMYIYIASKCAPEDAIKIFEKLIKAFPKHPCYETFGFTKTQKLLYKTEKQQKS